VFEWIEKLFASLIVLVMLFILLLVAFPDRLETIFGSDRDDRRAERQEQQQDRDLTGPTALPKGDVKPQKTVGRLADSSDNQKALYRYRYREKPAPREVRAERREGYVMTRRVVYSRPEYPNYYARRYEREPRYSSAREDCSSGACLCNCRKPYWASSGDWDEDAECWYE
jgi:hypothetical protein